MNVLVIGATGKTGRPVVEALRARGVRVRAASRSGEVRFDWADEKTWAPALEGAEGLYVVGPYAEPDASVLLRRLLASAPDVRRVVLLSVLGGDRLPEPVRMAGWERDVRESGKEWTVLRPNWFHQNFGEGAFTAALREDGGLALPAADAPVSFVDTRDIAEAAAAALTEDGHAGQVYTLTGPEALTHAQALEVLGTAAGRDLGYTPLTPERFSDRLRAAGASEVAIAWQLALFDLMRAGVNAEVTDVLERLTGRPARSLAAYAAEHATAWRVDR